MFRYYKKMTVKKEPLRFHYIFLYKIFVLKAWRLPKYWQEHVAHM